MEYHLSASGVDVSSCISAQGEAKVHYTIEHNKNQTSLVYHNQYIAYYNNLYMIHSSNITYVTGSAKTSLMDQNLKIDFLSYLNRALN